MVKETLEEMKNRHSKEISNFQKNCPHTKVIVLETSITAGNIHSPIHNHKTEPGNKYKCAGYESILLKCVDCGTPILDVSYGKVSLYVKPHYLSDDVVKHLAVNLDSYRR